MYFKQNFGTSAISMFPTGWCPLPSPRPPVRLCFIFFVFCIFSLFLFSSFHYIFVSNLIASSFFFSVTLSFFLFLLLKKKKILIFLCKRFFFCNVFLPFSTSVSLPFPLHLRFFCRYFLSLFLPSTSFLPLLFPSLRFLFSPSSSLPPPFPFSSPLLPLSNIISPPFSTTFPLIQYWPHVLLFLPSPPPTSFLPCSPLRLHFSSSITLPTPPSHPRVATTK